MTGFGSKLNCATLLRALWLMGDTQVPENAMKLYLKAQCTKKNWEFVMYFYGETLRNSLGALENSRNDLRPMKNVYTGGGYSEKFWRGCAARVFATIPLAMETKGQKSYDRLISTMGFPILVRCHLYTELGPWPISSRVISVALHCLSVSELSMSMKSTDIHVTWICFEPKTEL